MIQVAVMGYGTIGSGVVEVLETNKDKITEKTGKEIAVKYILDLREFPGDPHEAQIVHDFEIIEKDEEVEIVVEAMGGVNPAYKFAKACLLAGKHVVTSNKALVAAHGTELLAIAREKNLNFLFEASVGGGIPLLRPLTQSLAGEKIEEISGILNGTTNFILTEMTNKGADFDTVLKEAQQLGYAEADPTADIEGLDAGRKVAIMASIAFHSRVTFDDVYTEGITKITAKDVEYAEEFGDVIKLLGVAHNTEEGIEVAVHPMMIPKEHPLASVRDSFNAVFVRSDAAGDTMFYGRGAGELPTASAIMGDVIDVIRRGCIHGRRHHIVVVAEGVGHVHEYAQTIEEETGLETRVTVLGYIQRGGAPSGRDRVSAAMMGVRAIDVLKSDASSRVIVEWNGRFEDMDIEEALQMKRELDEEMFVACNRIDTSYQYHHKKTT